LSLFACANSENTQFSQAFSAKNCTPKTNINIDYLANLFFSESKNSRMGFSVGTTYFLDREYEKSIEFLT